MRAQKTKRPGHEYQCRVLQYTSMLVSIAIWASGNAKLSRIARCRIARPAVISIPWFWIKRFMYRVWERVHTGHAWQFQFCPNSAYAPFFLHLQHSLLCFYDSNKLNSASFVFFFALITDSSRSFWETQVTKPRNVSWKVLSQRQPGPAGSRIPDNLNFDKGKMVLRPECFCNHDVSDFWKHTSRQQEKSKEAKTDTRARELNHSLLRLTSFLSQYKNEYFVWATR